MNEYDHKPKQGSNDRISQNQMSMEADVGSQSKLKNKLKRGSSFAQDKEAKKMYARQKAKKRNQSGEHSSNNMEPEAHH